VDVWNEFNRDTNTANAKYRDQFVRVTGTIRVYTENNTPRLFFEAPREKPDWGIEVTLVPTEMKDISDKKKVTLRGRFLPRKGAKEHVLMSNCNVVKVHPGT
jgi:hypothetical protein